MQSLPWFYLFGSAARGDLDAASDLDVLAIYETEPETRTRDFARLTTVRRFGEKAMLAEYSHDRMKRMFAIGHLFAWHLYYEAKLVDFSDVNLSISRRFGEPSTYTDARTDAERFLQLLISVDSEVQNNPGSILHEAGIAYLALRNIAMSVSAAYSRQPDFTRNSPFSVSKTLSIPPPCSQDQYELLVAARHTSQRGNNAPLIEADQLKTTLETALAWARVVTRITHDS